MESSSVLKKYSIRISIYSLIYVIVYKYYYSHYLYKIFFGQKIFFSFIMTTTITGIFEITLKFNDLIKD